MTTIAIKPNPAKPSALALKHPVSGALIDAQGNVPDAGREWLYDGFTCRMLVDGAVLRADDPIFAAPKRDDASKPVVDPLKVPDQPGVDASLQPMKPVAPIPSESSVKPSSGR